MAEVSSSNRIWLTGDLSISGGSSTTGSFCSWRATSGFLIPRNSRIARSWTFFAQEIHFFLLVGSNLLRTAQILIFPI
ncbi:MAG: hypothetical protein ABSE84_12115 [Isosphaeraceae bacterium]|jgi:hypothetical protein